MNELNQDQLDYINFVKTNYPVFFADRIQPILSNAGLGAIGADDTNVFSQILSSVSSALPSFTQAYTQYAATQAALEQQTQRAATNFRLSSGSSGIPMWLILGGVGLVGVALFASRRR